MQTEHDVSTDAVGQVAHAIEREARQIAAWKMGLVKDRRGERLPDDLWRQCIPQARAALGLDNE